MPCTPTRSRPWFGATCAIAALLSACTSNPSAPSAPETSSASTPAAGAPVQAPVSTATPASAAPATDPLPPRIATPRTAPARPAASEAARLDPSGIQQYAVESLSEVPRIDLTTPPDDLWERIRRGFAMPDLKGPLVQEKVAFYTAQPEYLARMIERSRRYLYHIVDELERRALPTELALLPMVESAFNPMAYSRAHASGIWQFIPPTGKRYSLQQSWWFDARRDIVDSTTAALEYLTDLYEMHGDWHLALASYNYGENGVARAIEKNRAAGLPLDYAYLPMPSETRYYVPKLQALKNIIANPAAFGVALDPIPNAPYFATVTKTRDIDIQLAAKLAEMPVEEFIALNPGFSRPFIPVSVNSRLVIPADRVDVFHANLEKYDQKTLVSWKVYRPGQGERLEAIARKFRLTLAQLKEVNGIGPRTRGTPPVLVVPTESSSASHIRLPIMYAPPAIASLRRGAVHVVRTGETLYGISRRYGVSIANLQRWNGVTTQIVIGQRLVVGARSAARGSGKGKPVRQEIKGRPR